MGETTSRGIDCRNVSLVRRRITDVSAGDGNHFAAIEIESGRYFFARGEQGDGCAPLSATVGYREFLDVTIG